MISRTCSLLDFADYFFFCSELLPKMDEGNCSFRFIKFCKLFVFIYNFIYYTISFYLMIRYKTQPKKIHIHELLDILDLVQDILCKKWWVASGYVASKTSRFMAM